MSQQGESNKKLHAVNGYLAWFSADTSFAAAIAINGFALPVLVLMETGSAASAGIVTATGTAIAGVANIFGGWLQDTINKRTIVIWSSLAGVVLFLAGVILLATGNFNLITATTLAIFFGIRAGLSGTTTNVMLRSFIPADLLPKAISVGQARDSVIEFGGAPLGAFLLDMGKIFPYLGNVILNCLALLSALLLPKHTFDPVDDLAQATEKRLTLRGITAGMVFLRKSRLLRVISTSGNLAFAMFNAALLVTTCDIVARDGNARTAGFLNSGIAIGVFLGAIAAPRLTSRFRGGLLALLAYMLPLISLLLLLPSASSYMKVAVLTPAMFLLPAGSAVMGSIQMLAVSKDALGRFFAAIGVIELILSALSTAAVSAIYEQLGFRVAIGVCLVTMILCIAHLAITPEVRNIPKSEKFEEYVAELPSV